MSPWSPAGRSMSAIASLPYRRCSALLWRLLCRANRSVRTFRAQTHRAPLDRTLHSRREVATLASASAMRCCRRLVSGGVVGGARSSGLVDDVSLVKLSRAILLHTTNAHRSQAEWPRYSKSCCDSMEPVPALRVQSQSLFVLSPRPRNPVGHFENSTLGSQARGGFAYAKPSVLTKTAVEQNSGEALHGDALTDISRHPNYKTLARRRGETRRFRPGSMSSWCWTMNLHYINILFTTVQIPDIHNLSTVSDDNP